MKPSVWNWRPARTEGIWRHGCLWARPLTAAAPWLSLLLLLVMFRLMDGRLAAAPGVSFDLPAATVEQSDEPGMAAFALPMRNPSGDGVETLVLFDDARYWLFDTASVERLRARIGERASGDGGAVMLLFADRRVPSGDLMRLVGIARESGVVRVQVAERRE